MGFVPVLSDVSFALSSALWATASEGIANDSAIVANAVTRLLTAFLVAFKVCGSFLEN